MNRRPVRTAPILLTLRLAPPALAADLSGTKTSLLNRLDALNTSTARLARAAALLGVKASGQ